MRVFVTGAMKQKGMVGERILLVTGTPFHPC
jgi:hypothetical protein